MNHAILIREHGGPAVMHYESVAQRQPGPGEVLLHQEAVGVNFVDSLVRTGKFPMSLPTILGFEAAGTIAAVGSDQVPFKVGDHVGYFFAQGAYANYNVVDASALIALPNDISAVRAAAFLAKGLTAWMGLYALHRLSSGETILVQGASGGVGTILTRWARYLGATVIGVAGSAQKLPIVAKAASLALTSTDPHFLDKVRALAPRGVDVVYDFVGEATFQASVAAVRDGGKILTIGAASGQPQMEKAELARRSIEVRGGGTPQFVNPGNQNAAAADLFEAIRRGLFNDIDIVERPLEMALSVHEAMESRRLAGLTVLRP